MVESEGLALGAAATHPFAICDDQETVDRPRYRELIDELEESGYVRREPDPTDRRAKLIRLTDVGRETVTAARVTISGIEQRLDEILGAEGHRSLRAMLEDIVRRADDGPPGAGRATS